MEEKQVSSGREGAEIDIMPLGGFQGIGALALSGTPDLS
jgi:hypothetical protein